MKLTKLIAYSLLLLGAVSLPAAAQQPAGKFTVAHETHWGTAVLPAGSYSVSLQTGTIPYVVITSDTHNPVSIMAVAQYLETAQCKGSSLELEQNEGAWNVRSLCFESSVAVYFGPSERLNHGRTAGPQVASLSASH